MFTAVIALIATIVGAFFGSLIAEDYKRFRTAKGIAAALSGELTGYVEGGRSMNEHFCKLKAIADTGQDIPFYKFPAPKDVLYEALAENIGLLGVNAARDVAYCYQRLHGIRIGYGILIEHHASWKPPQVAATLANITEAMSAMLSRAEPLIRTLNAIAESEYTWPHFPRIASKSAGD